MVQIGFKCSKGIVRKNNEDACFVIPSHDVYIVADGVGGNNSGEIASRTAVSDIAGYVTENDISACQGPEEIFGFLSEAVRTANENVYKAGMDEEQNRGMATTVVLTYIRDMKAYVANVGDSRAYLFRNGNLKRITSDHTYVNELIKKGVITEDEAEHHQQKNVITKALGAEYYVEPDFYQVKLKEGDVLLLCSDGLYGEVKESAIAGYIDGAENMNELCTQLVDEAIKAGGRDNITVVCLRI